MDDILLLTSIRLEGKFHFDISILATLEAKPGFCYISKL